MCKGLDLEICGRGGEEWYGPAVFLRQWAAVFPFKGTFSYAHTGESCILILYRFRRRSTKSTGRSTRRSLPLSSQTSFYLRVCLVCCFLVVVLTLSLRLLRRQREPRQTYDPTPQREQPRSGPEGVPPLPAQSGHDKLMRGILECSRREIRAIACDIRRKHVPSTAQNRVCGSPAAARPRLHGERTPLSS